MKHLIVKFGAPGDALRTTPLARRLKGEGGEVTWISDAASREVLEASPVIDRLWVAEEAEHRLDGETFDAVWSLDEDPAACALAARARAATKRGLGRDGSGALVPLTPEAAYMVLLARDDDLKFRRNRKTVPEIQFEACGLEYRGERYAFRVSDADRAAARAALAEAGAAVSGGRPAVALHVGCGPRWPTKAWTRARWAGLSRALADEGVVPLVAAGPAERPLVDEVVAFSGGAARPLEPLPVRPFAAALLGLECLVCADSLALHLALAVGRPVVGLFCPTAPAEIEWYGLGEAVAAEGPAGTVGPCYRGDCRNWPACVETIGVERVLEAVRRRRRPAEEV